MRNARAARSGKSTTSFSMPDLDALAAKATEQYLERTSIRFLECAIHLMMTHMRVSRVIELLQAQIDILKQYE